MIITPFDYLFILGFVTVNWLLWRYRVTVFDYVLTFSGFGYLIPIITLVHLFSDVPHDVDWLNRTHLWMAFLKFSFYWKWGAVQVAFLYWKHGRTATALR